MIDREVDIQTPDGLMNTFITYPEEGGPFPVIIFYMDAPGKREELHDMARRLGTTGYFVLLPNLYYRSQRDFQMQRTEEGRAEMFALMNSLNTDLVDSDTQAMLDFADSDENAAEGAVGCVGYCMSGPFVFSAASTFADRMAAAASFHGVRLYTDDAASPHLRAHKFRGELYFGCAETDDWAPREMIDGLDNYLKAAGSNYRIEWYPGTLHGFVFPQREGMYNKAAAERHWERLHALFERNLKKS